MEKIETIDDVFNLNLTDISSKQLQEVYNITQKSLGYCYNDKNGLTDNKLKCNIAIDLRNLGHFSQYDQQQCLDKSCEFNNSISNNCNIAEIEFINRNLRIPLIKKLMEVDKQKNFNKAQMVFNQVLDTLEGIGSKELKEYSSYHFVSNKTLEDKITEKEQKEVREKAEIVFAELKKTHTNNNLRKMNKNLEDMFKDFNEQMPQRSKSTPLL